MSVFNVPYCGAPIRAPSSDNSTRYLYPRIQLRGPLRLSLGSRGSLAAFESRNCRFIHGHRGSSVSCRPTLTSLFNEDYTCLIGESKREYTYRTVVAATTSCAKFESDLFCYCYLCFITVRVAIDGREACAFPHYPWISDRKPIRKI